MLSQATKGDSREDRERLFRIYGLGSTIGVLLPHSRMHENEADRLGLIYMAQAGYDPRVAISFWERMEKRNHFMYQSSSQHTLQAKVELWNCTH